MDIVYNEIPTDVDVCFWCGLEIDHECIEAKTIVTRRAPRYLHVECYEDTENVYENTGKWKLTKYVYVLNPGYQ